MLPLHLLPNCMVRGNTLMLQAVLAQPRWQGRLTAIDLRALTLPICEHVIHTAASSRINIDQIAAQITLVLAGDTKNGSRSRRLGNYDAKRSVL